MEPIKSTKVSGRVVYQFMQTYNQDASYYNRRHCGKSGNQEIEYLNWNDTVTKLEKMSALKAQEIKQAVSKVNQAYYRLLEKEVYPLLLDALKLKDITELW